MMDVYEAVTKRRSIRRFKRALVPYEVLEKCVDAARLAPSASNRQVLEYVIVDDERLLPAMLDAVMIWPRWSLPDTKRPPEEAPAAYIIVLINNTLEAELGASRRVVLYDVGIATENIVLIAVEHGVSSCVIATYAESRLKRLLNLPDDREVAMAIAMGYADEVSVAEPFAGSTRWWVDEGGTVHVPKRKLGDVLHHNRFVE